MLYTLEVKVVQDGEWYIAASEELELTGRGSTPHEACEELGEAITLFLDTAESEEVEQYLSRLKQVPPPRIRRKHRVDFPPAVGINPVIGELELAYA